MTQISRVFIDLINNQVAVNYTILAMDILVIKATHPGVPLIQGLDVDEGHFSIGAGHHSIMLTADNQINVLPKLPVTVPETINS